MKKILILFIFFSAALLQQNLYAQNASVEEKLVVINNTRTVNGNFQVAVQVKGTNIPKQDTSNTLGSATIDVQYDNKKLTFVKAADWDITPEAGYTRDVNNIGTFLRIAVTGTNVGDIEEGASGYDIPADFRSWVTLNFTIKSAEGYSDLRIAPGSNAVGVFKNTSNYPSTGEIWDILNLTRQDAYNELLPVERKSISKFTDFALLQNYPNPFNPSTTISFSLAKKSYVKLTVFNSIGKLISVLADGVRDQGISEVSFKPKELSSGVYFYLLEANALDGSKNFREVKRMLFLK